VYRRLTAADDAFDWVGEIGDIANGRHDEHVLAARVGRDGRQQLTINECSHAHRHDTYVHVGSLPCLRQRRRSVGRRVFGYKDDRQPQN